MMASDSVVRPPVPNIGKAGEPVAACGAGAETMSFFERIREDIASVLERDPAARSKVEVLTCYPGLWAVWIHRVSNALWAAKLRLLARMLSQFGRFLTGVDIHPAAILGRRLFID